MNISAILSSKLEGSWSSPKSSSFITQEILTKATEKFDTLETSIKLKLLFASLTLRKNEQKQFRDEIQQLFSVAQVPNPREEWVQIIASILSDFNGTGFLANDSTLQIVDSLKTICTSSSFHFFTLSGRKSTNISSKRETLLKSVVGGTRDNPRHTFHLKKENRKKAIAIFNTPNKIDSNTREIWPEIKLSTNEWSKIEYNNEFSTLPSTRLWTLCPKTKTLRTCWLTSQKDQRTPSQ